MSVEHHGAMNLSTNTMVIMVWKALDDIDLDPDVIDMSAAIN